MVFAFVVRIDPQSAIAFGMQADLRRPRVVNLIAVLVFGLVDEPISIKFLVSLVHNGISLVLVFPAFFIDDCNTSSSLNPTDAAPGVSS